MRHAAVNAWCALRVSNWQSLALVALLVIADNHRSCNSRALSLMPVCAADWCAVTTVEGIGSCRSGQLHPVQERLTAMHGSQCGFCTPGIVMAMYSQLRTAHADGRRDVQFVSVVTCLL